MRSLVEKRSWLGRRYDFSSTDRDQPRPLFYLTRVGRDRTGFEKRSVILWGFFGHANDRPGNAVGHRPAPSDWTGPTSRKRRDRVPADWVPRVRPHRFFFPRTGWIWKPSGADGKRSLSETPIIDTSTQLATRLFLSLNFFLVRSNTKASRWIPTKRIVAVQ